MATTPLDGLRFASQDATAGADGQQGSLSWTACAGQWPLMMRPTCSSASVCVGVYTASVNGRNLKATQSCVPPASLPQHPPPLPRQGLVSPTAVPTMFRPLPPPAPSPTLTSSALPTFPCFPSPLPPPSLDSLAGGCGPPAVLIANNLSLVALVCTHSPYISHAHGHSPSSCIPVYIVLSINTFSDEYGTPAGCCANACEMCLACS